MPPATAQIAQRRGVGSAWTSTQRPAGAVNIAASTIQAVARRSASGQTRGSIVAADPSPAMPKATTATSGSMKRVSTGIAMSAAPKPAKP